MFWVCWTDRSHIELSKGTLRYGWWIKIRHSIPGFPPPRARFKSNRCTWSFPESESSLCVFCTLFTFCNHEQKNTNASSLLTSESVTSTTTRKDAVARFLASKSLCLFFSVFPCPKDVLFVLLSRLHLDNDYFGMESSQKHGILNSFFSFWTWPGASKRLYRRPARSPSESRVWLRPVWIQTYE